MSYNTKNYTEQGAEKTVIGGTLEITGTLDIKEGATVNGLPDPVIPKAAYQADAYPADVADMVSIFNGLLDKLIAAGLMESAPVEENNGENAGNQESGNGNNSGDPTPVELLPEEPVPEIPPGYQTND